MDKAQFRKMIREEVEKELYKILPSLLKSTINEIMTKEMKRVRKPPSRRRVIRESSQSLIKKPPTDPSHLQSLLGYGDMKPGAAGSISTERMVAGVKMDGGLEDMEKRHGVAHMRDYNSSSEALPDNLDSADIEEEHSPQFSSTGALPGGVDGGAAVPADLVAAMGRAAKKTLDEAALTENWRPGMKRK